jgi:hypothetical protein
MRRMSRLIGAEDRRDSEGKDIDYIASSSIGGNLRGQKFRPELRNLVFPKTLKCLEYMMV